MAKIVEDVLVIKFSSIVKDGACDQTSCITEEVKAALDEVGNPVFGGWTTEKDGAQAVSREMFIMPLVNAVKELSARVKELEAKVNA